MGMSRSVSASAWFARVRHDLVKHTLWPARDRREAGGLPAPRELVPRLVDGEGRPIGAPALWAELRADAPAGLLVEPSDPIAAFEAALGRALAAAEAGDVAGVLAFEADVAALEQLVRSLDGTG